jgi:hypothetical protein
MNAEEDSMRGKQRQAIHQTTMILPYFDEEVPVVYLADGTAYLPVRALCRMLGLRAETHIFRWRKLVLWASARKLPLQTARGQRMVWCLHLGALPFWCACFNWPSVKTERRAQLRQATDEWLWIIEQAQQEMLTRYRSMRRLLFEFLTTYVDADTKLNQLVLCLSPRLNVDSRARLEELLSRGQTLICEAMAHARKMLHEQAEIPIVDAVTLDAEGEVTGTFSLPLFPVVPREDDKRLFEYIAMLTQWHRDMCAFLEEEEPLRHQDHEW